MTIRIGQKSIEVSLSKVNMDRMFNGRGVLNQLRKLTFPGAGPTVVSLPGVEGTHGKGNKGLPALPLRDRNI